jgi:Fe2+ transport system protein FeoA
MVETMQGLPNERAPWLQGTVPMSGSARLCELQTGQEATIVRVGGAGPLRRRFAEMGLVRGATIRVDRVAPLGDPVAYRIKGYLLSLRREDAACIEVQLQE